MHIQKDEKVKEYEADPKEDGEITSKTHHSNIN